MEEEEVEKEVEGDRQAKMRINKTPSEARA